MTKKNILITGASGLIGSRLTELLIKKGHTVSHLGRKAKTGSVPSFVWDVEKGTFDPQALVGVNSIIHLAGAGIADKPWSEERKKEILESRTHSTQLLFKELSKGNHSVSSIVAASAVGYYGFGQTQTEFTEESAAGDDFLATVTRLWEEEINKLSTLGLSIAKVRIGIVLSEKGGALKPMILPVKLFVGSPLGSGKQMLSWIHLDDLCSMFIHLVENDQLSGAFNGTGPYAVSNKEFTKAIAKELGRPMFLPNVPSFILKLLVGEMADLILQGSVASSKKIQNTGFTFQFHSLEAALKNLLHKS